MKADLCENGAMRVRACKGCGLLFMPARDEDRCALCRPRERNKPIDLWAHWAHD